MLAEEAQPPPACGTPLVWMIIPQQQLTYNKDDDVLLYK
jgi:hypothetical protein